VLDTPIYAIEPHSHHEGEAQRDNDKTNWVGACRLFGWGTAGRRGWRGNVGDRSHGCGGIEGRIGIVKAAILEALGKSWHLHQTSAVSVLRDRRAVCSFLAGPPSIWVQLPLLPRHHALCLARSYLALQSHPDPLFTTSIFSCGIGKERR